MKAFILTLSMVFGLSSVGPIGSFSIGESIHAQSSSAKPIIKSRHGNGKKNGQNGQNRKNKDRNKQNDNLYSSSKKKNNKRLVCKKIKNKKGIRKKVCKLLRK